MGAEFQPCSDLTSLNNHNTEIHLQPYTRTPIPSHSQQYCHQEICHSQQQLHSSKDLEERRRQFNLKYNTTPFKSTRSNLTSPKMNTAQQSRQMSNRKNKIDGRTIERRKELGLTASTQKPEKNEQNEQISKTKQKMRCIINNICVNDQDHLIDIIDRIQKSFTKDKSQVSEGEQGRVNEDLLNFLIAVEKTQLDFLDMLYHNDEDIYGKRLKDLNFKRDIQSNIINLKEFMMQEREFPGSEMVIYEKYKKIGFNMIKNKKVCFFVMTGGKGSRFSISTPASENKNNSNSEENYAAKQFHKLDIPSQRGILQIIIRRFLALTEKFDCQVTLFLGTTTQKIQDLASTIFNLTNNNSKLIIYPFSHKIMGAIDYEGKLVIEDNNLPSHWAIGTADIWNVLMGDKSLNFPSVSDLIKQGFEYIQVLGTSNALQKCFDCFALGLAKQINLDWTTKIVQSFQKNNICHNNIGLKNIQMNVQSKIFENNLAQIYVCDPQQLQNYPQHCSYTFINSSLFKLKYLETVFHSAEWQNLQPRKKIHHVNYHPPFSKYESIISYERDYTDIFRLAKVKLEDIGCGFKPYQPVQQKQEVRWRLILCDQSDYYPLVYNKHHHSDIKCASEAIIDLHRNYLGIQNRIRVQIDAAVSLQGQDLESIKEEVRRSMPSEDEQIFIEDPSKMYK